MRIIRWSSSITAILFGLIGSQLWIPTATGPSLPLTIVGATVSGAIIGFMVGVLIWFFYCAITVTPETDT